MMGLFYEDMELDTTYKLGDYQFTEENIRRFSVNFAPVAFHMDDEAAANGLFGKRSAVGFHICSAWMPCFVAVNKAARESITKQGKHLPEIGAGFGLENIRWIAPVFAGDTLSFKTTLINKRILNTKPNWGLIELLNEGFRHGECVIRFNSKMLVATRTRQIAI
jgi:acyl dehydratase